MPTLSLSAEEPPEPVVPVEVDWQELTEERSAFTKTYLNHLGNETFELGPGPLHYQPMEGSEWLEIDTSLGWDNGWVNTTNSFPTHLPSSLGSGEAFQFGPEHGLTWRPGTLGARLTSGALVVLAEPLPTNGYQPDEGESSILYPNLYPGVDLRATIASGELFFETEITAWEFELLEEEIDRLFIKADLEAQPELLGQIDERLGAGEPVGEVPLYFGRSGDEYSIVIVRDPGIDADAVEAAFTVVRPDEEYPPSAEALEIAENWTSPLSQWFGTQRLNFWMPKPNLEGLMAHGTTSSALTASFKIRASSSVRHARFWSSTPVPAGSPADQNTRSVESKCVDFFPLSRRFCAPLKTHQRKILVGRKSDGHYRARVAFHGIESLKPSFEAKGIGKIWLGYNTTTSTKPPGVPVQNARWVVAAGNCAVLDPALPPPPPAPYPQRTPDPPKCSYNSTEAYDPGDGAWGGASWAVGDPFGGGTQDRRIGSSYYRFGELWRRDHSYKFVPPTVDPDGFDNAARATIWAAIKRGRVFSLPLRNPYDQMLCAECTQNPSLPLPVRGSSGKLDVGMELTDVRLAVEMTNATNEAEISVTTAGNNAPVLYPGGSLDFTIKLITLAGNATEVSVHEQPFNLGRHGMSGDFYRGGQRLTSAPTLTTANPEVTYRVTSVRAVPKYYDWPRFGAQFGFNFNASPYYGSVQGTGSVHTGGGGRLRIPFTPKAPEATWTTSGTSGGTLGTDTAQSSVSLGVFSVANFKGAQWAALKLEVMPGSPMKLLKEGTHWFSDRRDPTNGNGGLIAYPNQMKPGLYNLKVTPCLEPAGSSTAPLHCLSNLAWTERLDIADVTPSGPIAIEWLEPASLDSSSSASTLKIHGTNLGGVSSSVTVTSPLSRSGSVSGNDDLLNAPLAAVPSSACGPVEVKVTRTDGQSATASLNVVKPFRGGAPHVIFEAEAADGNRRKDMTEVASTAASNGAHIDRSNEDAAKRGRLVYEFKAPSSGDWQVYLMAAASDAGKRHFTRVIVRNAAGNEKTNYVWAERLSNTSFAMKNTYKQGGTPGSSKVNLTAGETYTLVLSNEPSAGAFPQVDMIVLSAGTLPPLSSEVCR